MGCNPCSAPKGPDYAEIAQQQGAANLNSAIAGQNLSNPNTFTPYGTSQWTDTGFTTLADGTQIPNRPTLTETLSEPELQKLNLSNQAQVSSLQALNAAMPNITERVTSPFGLAGSVQADPALQRSGAIQRQFDYAGAPGMPRADAGVRDQVSQSFFDQGARFLVPQFQQRQTDLDTMLANQGITRGSEAQQREQGGLDTQRTQQLNDLASRSVMAGGDAMSQLFGLQMGARQQGVQEATNQGQFWNTAQNQAANQLLADQAAYNNARGQAFSEYSANRSMPINMLNALISSSQVNNPQFQPYTAAQVAPPPLLAAAQMQDQANAARYNSQMGLLGSLIGGAGSLGAGYLMGGR